MISVVHVFFLTLQLHWSSKLITCSGTTTVICLIYVLFRLWNSIPKRFRIRILPMSECVNNVLFLWSKQRGLNSTARLNVLWCSYIHPFTICRGLRTSTLDFFVNPDVSYVNPVGRVYLCLFAPTWACMQAGLASTNFVHLFQINSKF